MRLRYTPLTDQEIIDMAIPTCGPDAGYKVTAKYAFDLSDLIDNDLDGWLDLLSETIIGRVNLMEPNFHPTGVTQDGLVVGEVSGIVDLLLEEFAENGLINPA